MSNERNRQRSTEEEQILRLALDEDGELSEDIDPERGAVPSGEKQKNEILITHFQEIKNRLTDSNLTNKEKETVQKLLSAGAQYAYYYKNFELKQKERSQIEDKLIIETIIYLVIYFTLAFGLYVRETDPISYPITFAVVGLIYLLMSFKGKYDHINNIRELNVENKLNFEAEERVIKGALDLLDLTFDEQNLESIINLCVTIRKA